MAELKENLMALAAILLYAISIACVIVVIILGVQEDSCERENNVDCHLLFVPAESTQ
jgi:hypothetical protein